MALQTFENRDYLITIALQAADIAAITRGDAGEERHDSPFNLSLLCVLWPWDNPLPS